MMGKCDERNDDLEDGKRLERRRKLGGIACGTSIGRAEYLPTMPGV
jgi:hypothetical protein